LKQLFFKERNVYFATKKRFAQKYPIFGLNNTESLNYAEKTFDFFKIDRKTLVEVEKIIDKKLNLI
jgi:hypothetical protein